MSGLSVAYGLPDTVSIRQFDTHRLVPSAYGSGSGDVLGQIADDEDHLRGIIELDQATSDGQPLEGGLLPSISMGELVSSVPFHEVVNAAFVNAHPLGSRFNGPNRGAWYAGFDLETSQAEVVWHKSLEFAEIEWVEWMEASIVYDDYLADFSGEYHDIRGKADYRACLDPVSYVASQKFAETLLAEGSIGLIYPSLRNDGGVCLACFRPALVGNVRKGARYRFTWTGDDEPSIELEDVHG